MVLLIKKKFIYISLTLFIFLYILASSFNFHFFDINEREGTSQKKIIIYKLQEYLQEYKAKCKVFPTTSGFLTELKNNKCVDGVGVDEVVNSNYFSDINYESDSKTYRIAVRINGKFITFDDKDLIYNAD